MIAGGHPPEKREQNLLAILEESIAHYYDDYCAKGRSITLNCETNRLKLFSNQDMLLRIFDNLIGNSLKHGTGELTISVQVRKPTAPYTDTQDKDLPTDIKSSIPCSLTIDFENSLTLPRPDLTRVFDEFYTTDISRTSGNTGLGLAIAKQFTEILGGKISASNVAEKFIVTVIFPQLTHPLFEKNYIMALL